MLVLYNNNSIIHTRFTYVESASCELALMPVLYNNHPIIHLQYYISSGEYPSSAHNRLARGNTHFSRTSVSHPHSAHSSVARSKHPLSAHVTKPLCAAATGFREPPHKPAWLRETPYTTISVFLVVTVIVTPQYPARASIPLCLGGRTPTLRTLALTV